MRTFLLVILALVLSALLNVLPIFVGDVGIILLASGTGLLFILGVYIEVDFQSVISGTKQMAVGEYKEANKNKYLVAILSLFCIAIECAIVSMLTEIKAEAPIAMYVLALFSVIAVYIRGIKKNKLATIEKG